MLKPLNNLLHQQLRLAIMSVLMNTESAEFNYLLEQTEASKGNLSVQLNKLKAAGYIEVEKSFRNNYPLTTCKITNQGKQAFEEYVNTISSYFKKS
tara:strand:- start:14 stop:301 length:288 start_codon:yes stop_codon:yes gene_type:complete